MAEKAPDTPGGDWLMLDRLGVPPESNLRFFSYERPSTAFVVL